MWGDMGRDGEIWGDHLVEDEQHAGVGARLAELVEPLPVPRRRPDLAVV